MAFQHPPWPPPKPVQTLGAAQQVWERDAQDRRLGSKHPLLDPELTHSFPGTGGGPARRDLPCGLQTDREQGPAAQGWHAPGTASNPECLTCLDGDTHTVGVLASPRLWGFLFR